MRNFLLGFAAGALGTYAAIKLANEETRKKLYTKAQQAADIAKDDLDYGLTVGKSKVLRAGVVARQEIRKGKEKVNEVTGELASRIADEFSSIEDKVKAKE